MKKTLFLILAFWLCFCLCACRDINDAPTIYADESSVGTTIITANKESAPLEIQIKTDLQESLTKQNAHAVISSMTINKSLTEEKSYSATVLVTAKTKYANWSYETIVNYTKYDQGWFFDNADWNSGEYALVKSPDVNTVIDWINSTDVRDDIKPSIEDGVFIEENSEDASNEDELLVRWKKFTKLALADEVTTYKMRMKYDPISDTWVYIKYSTESSIAPHNVDLSGNWSGVKIENFTWDGFDLTAKSPFGDKINGHFKRINGHPKSEEESFGWYSNGAGYYCQISLGTDGSSLSIYSFGISLTQHFYVSIG